MLAIIKKIEGFDRPENPSAAYRTVWRWHFYAGLFCLPFIIVLSLTGAIYLFKPQIDAWLDRLYEIFRFPGEPKPLDDRSKPRSFCRQNWRILC